ncbi:MAG: helix-turn-helix transcriptional regulator [Christensenellaceae bacterium]
MESTKYQILIGILFDLLRERTVSSSYLAKKYSANIRTIQRYLDELSVAGVPIQTKKGRNGGSFLLPEYRLPCDFLEREEYDLVLSSLDLAARQTGEESYRRLIEKFCGNREHRRYELEVTGKFLVDETAWDGTNGMSELRELIERAIDESRVLTLSYVNLQSERSQRDVEPHLLVLKQSVWYLFAWCRMRKAFRLFRLSRILSCIPCPEVFEKKEFTKADIPLHYESDRPSLTLRLSYEREAETEIVDWLGNLAVDTRTNTAECVLPDSEELIQKLLSFGASVTVLSPGSLRQKLLSRIRSLHALYER